MKAKDARVSAIGDFLSTTRVAKMLSAEGFFVAQISELRNKELGFQAKFLQKRNTFNVIMLSIPVVQSLVSFGVEELVFDRRISLTKSPVGLKEFPGMPGKGGGGQQG